MSHLVSPLDKLFPLSKDGPLDGQGESGSATESIASWRTIGIGDGGNEVNHTLTYLVSLLYVCTVCRLSISPLFSTVPQYLYPDVCMYVCMYVWGHLPFWVPPYHRNIQVGMGAVYAAVAGSRRIMNAETIACTVAADHLIVA